MITEELIAQIKQLPPLPDSVREIERIYANADSTFSDLVVVVEKDPMLTAELLRASNSPLYGFSKEITSVEQAVSLFGMGMVRGFALATIVKQNISLDLSAYKLSFDDLSRLSTLRNRFVSNWYRKIDAKKASILSAAVFLMELGKVVIAKLIKEQDKTLAFQELLTNMPVHKAEIELCGSQCLEVSANMFKFWNFGDDLIGTIYYAINYKKAPKEFQELALVLYLTRELIGTDFKLNTAKVEKAQTLLESNGYESQPFLEAVKKIHL